MVTQRRTPARCSAFSQGQPSAFRDVALLEATAAALVVASKAKDLADGLHAAAHSVDSGEAEGRLDRLIKVSNTVANSDV